MIIFENDKPYPQPNTIGVADINMENITEIIAITNNILNSGGLPENTDYNKFIQMSFERVFHYNPENYGVDEHDAKTLRGFFHNHSENEYINHLKPLFNV